MMYKRSAERRGYPARQLIGDEFGAARGLDAHRPRVQRPLRRMPVQPRHALPLAGRGAGAVPDVPGGAAVRGIIWCLWCYTLVPGWENWERYATREDARDARADLIESEGFPPEWVAIRRSNQDPPKRRPPKTTIDAVRAALAAGADW